MTRPVCITAAALALLLVGAAAWILWPASHQRTVEIRQDGRLLRVVDLESVQETEEMTVTYQGRTNVIRIEPGRIRMERADCLDQICVHMGYLKEGGPPIVCLPNRLSVSWAE